MSDLRAAAEELERRKAIEPGLADLWVAGWEDAIRFLGRAALAKTPADNEVEAPDPLTFSEEYRRGWYAARRLEQEGGAG